MGETPPTKLPQSSACHPALHLGGGWWHRPALTVTLGPCGRLRLACVVLLWRGQPAVPTPRAHPEARQRAQHGLFTLGPCQPPLPGMTSSSSHSGWVGRSQGPGRALAALGEARQGHYHCFRAQGLLSGLGLGGGQGDTVAKAPGLGLPGCPRLQLLFTSFKARVQVQTQKGGPSPHQLSHNPRTTSESYRAGLTAEV